MNVWRLAKQNLSEERLWSSGEASESVSLCNPIIFPLSLKWNLGQLIKLYGGKL